MKNNSYLLLFLSLLTLSSCRDKKAQKLFYNQALQDSLELYISQIQDICNPYNAPTILDIWINITSDFSGTERDTIIAMSAVYRISGPPGYSESFDGPIISLSRCKSADLIFFTDFSSRSSFSAVVFPIPLISLSSECTKPFSNFLRWKLIANRCTSS